MRLSPLVKWFLAAPLVLANMAVILVAVWLIGAMSVWGFQARWWIGLIFVLAPVSFLSALVTVAAAHIRHLRDIRDPQKVLVCSFQSLWVNLTGVGLGYLLLILFLLLAVVSAAH
jgi:hypothetical protein